MNRTTLRAFATGLFGTSLVALLLVLAGRQGAADSHVALASEPSPSEPDLVEAPADLVEVAPVPAWTEHTVARGDTLGKILQAQGAPVQAVMAAAEPHKDLANIRPGQVFGFRYEGDDAAPVEIRYALDEDRTLHLHREGESWTAQLDQVVYETRMARKTLTVDSTLWGAAIAAGLRPADIANIANVFQFDLDFNSEVRSGATLEVVLEELWKDGAVAKMGTPYAARLLNAGKEYVAIRHEHADGKVAYYDENGVARRRAFLRSPIAYGRVTSGFNLKRFHPVLKKKRPHYGVDFGAPTGTPVRSVGEGVVVYAGRSGGHGNFVKVKHNGRYTTSYSHLSRISVKKGQKISQGQLVGKVGSTGMSTGPHLHYQLWVDGKYKNPMTVELPRNIELPGSEKGAFNNSREQWLAVLDGEREPGSIDLFDHVGSTAIADATTD